MRRQGVQCLWERPSGPYAHFSERGHTRCSRRRWSAFQSAASPSSPKSLFELFQLSVEFLLLGLSTQDAHVEGGQVERGVRGADDDEPAESSDERRRGSDGWGRTMESGDTRERDMLWKEVSGRAQSRCAGRVPG